MYIENTKRGIRLNILVPVGLVFLVLLNGYKTMAVMLFAAVVHEAGHLAMAFICGANVQRMDIELWGGRMYYGGMHSYGKELAIALGGVAANLLLAPIGLLPFWGIYGKLFFYSCLCYALVNIIPAKTLDGGEVLRCALGMTCTDYVAYTAINTVNTLSVLLLCCIGLLCGALTGFNSSVVMLCLVSVVLAVEK